MSDYKSLPIWKRGMTLAHAVYAAIEGAGLKETEEGQRLRKAAVSVPSLIGEAFLETTVREPDEAVFLASARIEEIRRLLSSPPIASRLSESDRLDLEASFELLAQDLRDSGVGAAPVCQPS